MIHSTELERLASNGLSISEIAGELGITYDAARCRLRRAGLDVTPERLKSLRERVDDMRPLDAVDFLLNEMELLGEALSATSGHEVDSWPVHLTPAQRRIMICLVDARGAVRTRDQLHAAMMFSGTGNPSGSRIIDVLICRIRKSLPPEVGRIVNHWGVGFSFERGPS